MKEISNCGVLDVGRCWPARQEARDRQVGENPVT